MKLFVVKNHATVWAIRDPTRYEFADTKVGHLHKGDVVMLLKPGFGDHKVLSKFGVGYVHVSLVKSIDEGDRVDS